MALHLRSLGFLPGNFRLLPFRSGFSISSGVAWEERGRGGEEGVRSAPSARSDSWFRWTYSFYDSSVCDPFLRIHCQVDRLWFSFVPSGNFLVFSPPLEGFLLLRPSLCSSGFLMSLLGRLFSTLGSGVPPARRRGRLPWFLAFW